ncbi:quinone-interacting membrane-bound oxidoreductase complex subunit QmoC [Desulfobacca acetoxidans]|uniref:Heterodisulfide reductase subunit C n=1 Tax=Desulfobacca acetoxidans (strain ATCC 700848 / DSM 11109 / ASRB2) TaxID=880072 RepID=F2NF57_DESAR|nr:quinone-interacting membrane-bound oxidoreductase complex subunit QmoC [Desulfobacca acetoxidans]AEB08612.1 Heterodisulfide reductase subunit C [Desulfobacca acetoxidans DSM 11109]
MAEETVIKSDLQFVKRLQEYGGESLKKCFQCATCSVVCNISPDDSPYPRKEMIMAQWGLKDQIYKDPDIWLCHYCGDCTAYCPRGANPGEVIGAMRQATIEHYSTPSFLARLVSQPKFLPLLIAFPVLLILAIMKLVGTLGNIPAGKVVYSNMLPLLVIDAIFLSAAGFAVFVFLNGIRTYWKDLNSGVSPWKAKLSNKSVVSTLIEVLKEFIVHKHFKKCVTHYARATSHLMLVLGFISLATVTAWSAYYEWASRFGLIPHKESPFSLTEPIKWLALVGTVLLLSGIYLIYRERQNKANSASFGGYFDWLLIWVIIAVGFTGALSWLLRLANLASLAYPMYFLHLVSVFFLFFYAPYTKMAHMVYRTTALVFTKMQGRELA